MKKLFILAALACCAAVLTACGSASGKSASEVVKTVYEAIDAGDYVEALSYVYFDGKTAEEDRKMMTEMFRTFLGPQIRKMGGAQVTILSETIGDDGQALVELEIRYGNGKTDKDKAKCVKDASGVWKMKPAF